ncbi:uncharacterized mitochondrial protein-like protein [Tanacetum coccineum]
MVGRIIGSEGFLSSILLSMVIIVMVVIVVVDDVSLLKLSFAIIGDPIACSIPLGWAYSYSDFRHLPWPAACASRALLVKSAISCRRASKVMAGVSDVEVLLGWEDFYHHRYTRTKKFQGLNSSDGGNIRDRVKIAGEVIGSSDEIGSNTPNTRIHKDHPIDNVIGEVQLTVQTRRMTKPTSEQGFLSDVNKARLVVQGHRQEEGIDYEEVFALVAKNLRQIRLFLAYASFMGFLVYVDDIIFGSTNKELCTGFEKLMKVKYVAKILKKFNYSDVKSASTPVDLEKPLVKDGDADDVDVHLYRSMIGSLMYLTASRPDIMFAVCACARFQVTPKTSHLLAVKRIFRYLKGKPTLGLWYSRDSPFELVAYTDSDYARATQDRKSTTGGCQFLGNRLISWQCKKQTVVATSTTEAEYVAAASCCGQNQKHLGMSKEVGTPRYLSLVVPLKKVGDEVVHKELSDRMERAATTASSLEAEQDTLVDKKRVIITESIIRRDLHLDDAEGTDCLPTATIFEELARMGSKSTAWNEFSSTMASLIICLATNQKFNLSKYIFDAMVKHLDGGVKFLMYPPYEEVGEDSDHSTDSTQIPIIDQPSTSSKPKKKQPSKKTQRQEAEVSQDETKHEESVPTPFNDPQPSGEDIMQLTDLIVLYTKLQTQVLDLEKEKDAPAKEIAALKKRIQRLERKKMSRPTGLKRLKKVGMSRRVESSKDQLSLGDPEDASKQGRSIADLDKDDDVTLVDETQERQNDELMFDTGVLDADEMPVEAKVNKKDKHSTKSDDSTAGEAVTTVSVEGSAAPTTIEEITLAQTLIQIKPAKPKVVTTAATTTTTTRPEARRVEIEPEVPLKRKDQIALDEQIARDIQAKLDAELIEEQKLARKQEEEAKNELASPRVSI